MKMHGATIRFMHNELYVGSPTDDTLKDSYLHRNQDNYLNIVSHTHSCTHQCTKNQTQPI